MQKPSKSKRFLTGFLIGCGVSTYLLIAGFFMTMGTSPMTDMLFIPATILGSISLLVALPATAIPGMDEFVETSPYIWALFTIYVLSFWPVFLGLIALLYDPTLRHFRLRRERS